MFLLKQNQLQLTSDCGSIGFRREGSTTMSSFFDEIRWQMKDPDVSEITSEKIQQLEDLNNRTNDGRGSSVCRSILFYLQRNQLELGAKYWSNEFGAIGQYPELMNFMNDLFQTNYYKKMP